jgi:hypothetical protein
MILQSSLDYAMLRILILFCAFVCIRAGDVCGVDRYVSLNGTNDAGNKYTTWAGAATNIQWAVNFATNGETVWVSNGIYYLTNQVRVTNGILLKSFSGTWTNTIVNGNYPDSTNRCLYINHSNAIVEGFAFTNGFAPYVVAVTSSENGGGVYIDAGTLRSCLVTGNRVTNIGFGAGIYATGAKSMITNCSIIKNELYGLQSAGSGRSGAGAYLQTSAQMWNCLVFSNYTIHGNGYGAGVALYSGSLLCNSIISSNTTVPSFNSNLGGGVLLSSGGIVRNCLIMGNRCWSGAGVGAANTGNTIDNCTIIGNYAGYAGGGIYAAYSGGYTGKEVQLNNTIIYNNNSHVGMSYVGNAIFSNCCVNSTNGIEIFYPYNNITDNPAFENYAGGNYRLSRNSPCLNKGIYLSWSFTLTDLDGFSRIDKFSGKIDMGCYESHPRGMMFKAR